MKGVSRSRLLFLIFLSSCSNPFGNAVSDIVAPAVAVHASDLPTLLLVAAVLTTIGGSSALIVWSKPPTPPSYTSAIDRATPIQALKAIFWSKSKTELSTRAKSDFWIIFFVFTIFLSFFDAFSVLLNQIFEPQGYSEDAAGYFGAAMIIAGLIAAGVSAPLIDRVFVHRQALLVRKLIPS
jgi:MFS transporter, FLVCR family, MFS-domain-containing protein 7